MGISIQRYAHARLLTIDGRMTVHFIKYVLRRYKHKITKWVCACVCMYMCGIAAARFSRTVFVELARCALFFI